MILLAQLHQRETPGCTLADDRAIHLPKMGGQPPEEFFDTLPEPLIPFLLPWHHVPYQREHARVLQQTDACSSYGVTSRMMRITRVSNSSHVCSTSILGLLQNRSRRRSILLAFASLAANNASAT
jgi:hypothetical protein